MGAGETLRIGTRGSKLALWQANWVKSQLESLDPDLTVELTAIKTQGDRILEVPLARVGGKGLFVKEIEEALLEGRVDLAVHSMKDMPADLPAGLCIGPVPERENPSDALVSIGGAGLMALKPGARVGTSSLRRAAQLRHARPDLVIVSLRGNLDTRLGKLDQGQMDAVVLAAAGMRRLGVAHRISQILDHGTLLPAVAQGALCIEIRVDDARVAQRLAPLNHPQTRTTVLGERAFLHRLGGSCQVPVAGHGRLLGAKFVITGLVADLEGKTVIRNTLSGSPETAEATGVALAERLLAMGAAEILQNLQD